MSIAILHLLQQRGHGLVLVTSTVRDATSYVLRRCRFAMSSTMCQRFELLARFLAMSRSRSCALHTATVTVYLSGLGQSTYLYSVCVPPVSAASDSQRIVVVSISVLCNVQNMSDIRLVVSTELSLHDIHCSRRPVEMCT